MKHKAIFLVLISLILLTGCKQKEPQAGPGGEVFDPAAEVNFLKGVLKTDPNNLNAWIKLGDVSMDAGNYPQAIDAYTRALELKPDNLAVRVDLGSCLRYVGQQERAIAEYKKVLAVDPNHSFANRNLAITLAYDLQKYDEAASVLENYLKNNPSDPARDEIKAEIQKFRMKRAG